MCNSNKQSLSQICDKDKKLFIKQEKVSHSFSSTIHFIPIEANRCCEGVHSIAHALHRFLQTLLYCSGNDGFDVILDHFTERCLKSKNIIKIVDLLCKTGECSPDGIPVISIFCMNLIRMLADKFVMLARSALP